MGLNLRERIIDWLFSGNVTDRYKERADFVMDRREYRLGIQKRFIRVLPNQPDDNLVDNKIRTIVNRTVSMLMGKGVTLEWPEGSDAQQAYIEQVLKANEWDLLLHKAAMSGAEGGQVFVKLLPVEGKEPRIILLDNALMDIETDRHDFQKITKYTIQYKTTTLEGKETAYKQETEWTPTSDKDTTIGYWLITDWEVGPNGTWQLVGQPISWEYDFPPIVSWQNLPNLGEAWGEPDITKDLIELQDRYNATQSYNVKTIRLHAFPKLWGRNIGKFESLSFGPDKIISFSHPEAFLDQLPELGDLSASYQLQLGLKKELYDNSRTVDISSMADKLGAITNFGLHVLYQDALAKTETKRKLYGWGIVEIVKRLLELAGMEPVEVKTKWADPLPENRLEAANTAQV
jgi:hypothetical protein